MSNISYFCMAMIHVYESCYKKYLSWPAHVPKLKFEEQFRLWLHFLSTLAHLEDSDPRGYWQNEFEKIEPSELAFLTQIRCKPFVTSLSLDEENLVYRTLKKLYCK